MILESRGLEDPTKEIDDDKELTTLEKSRALKSPILSFANTDMAFRDDLLVAGNYHGFNMYKIDERWYTRSYFIDSLSWWTR